jgi:hypothetical protein
MDNLLWLVFSKELPQEINIESLIIKIQNR